MKSRIARQLGLLALCLLCSSETRAQEIVGANSARALGEGQWKWTVYISAAKSVLNRVSCVEYTLHPTFKKPVQKICERKSNTTPFPYTATGWGTFEIGIKVIMKDGGTISLTHKLSF